MGSQVETWLGVGSEIKVSANSAWPICKPLLRTRWQLFWTIQMTQAQGSGMKPSQLSGGGGGKGVMIPTCRKGDADPYSSPGPILGTNHYRAFLGVRLQI